MNLKKAIGRTKAQVLAHDQEPRHRRHAVQQDRERRLRSPSRKQLPVVPQTCAELLEPPWRDLRASLRPAWGYPLDQQAIKDAFAVAKRLGVTAKGRQRDRRRPSTELDRLLQSLRHGASRGAPSSIPMTEASSRSRSSRRAVKRKSSRSNGRTMKPTACLSAT